MSFFVVFPTLAIRSVPAYRVETLPDFHSLTELAVRQANRTAVVRELSRLGADLEAKNDSGQVPAQLTKDRLVRESVSCFCFNVYRPARPCRSPRVPQQCSA